MKKYFAIAAMAMGTAVAANATDAKFSQATGMGAGFEGAPYTEITTFGNGIGYSDGAALEVDKDYIGEFPGVGYQERKDMPEFKYEKAQSVWTREDTGDTTPLAETDVPF